MSQKYQIIIPTLADPSLIVPCVQRVIGTRNDAQVELVIVCNAKDEQTAAFSKFQIDGLTEAMNAGSDNPVVLTWLDLGGPKGWPAAVNAGVKHCLENLADKIVVMNDDALVTPHWLERMSAAFDAEGVHLNGELMRGDKGYLSSAGRTPCGKIGMVGPTTNNARGTQQIHPPEVSMANGSAFTVEGSGLLDQFSEQYASENTGAVLGSNFLSGFCIMYSDECLRDLLEGDDDPYLLDPVFGVGGYDDNDICVRAELAGWRRAISLETYIHHLGHQTLDTHFPESQRGLSQMVQYLDKWSDWTQREQTAAAVYRVRLFTMNDLQMLRASMLRMGQLVDHICILFTDNPAAITKAYDWQLGQVPPADAQMIAKCSEAKDAQGVEAALRDWMSAIAEECDRDITTKCAIWQGEWNERDERNASIELADLVDADWVFSVDHDEIVEDRVSRKFIERLMKNPDPEVMVYDIGWLNHWDSPRLCRVDPPWASPDYRSTMRGFRFWRRTPASPRKIQGGTDIGLHCGNCPDFDLISKRVANLRMRHFGYMRHQDRVRKWQFYRQIDPTPSSALTQGTQSGAGSYDHLVNEEGMQISPYCPQDGIAFSMLVYKDEQAPGLYRMLSSVYSMTDQIVLVWTGKDPEPDGDIKAIGEAFGVQWVHCEMNDDLAACRNAGMRFIRDNKEPGVSWFFTMDDDENFEDSFSAMVSVRRMAEVSDSFGWMFRFRNFRHDGNWNWSETTRMMRLDEQGVVKYTGRVHETVEKAFQKLQSDYGIHPQVRYAPFAVNHFGLTGNPEELQPKLEKYTKLLIKEIEDNPTDASPWVSLALQYGNDGRHEERDRCIEIACEHAGRGYLPFKIAADVALREAKEGMREAVKRLAPAHPFYKTAMEMVRWLDQHAAEQPIGGAGANGGTAIPEGFDLDTITKLVEGDDQTTPSNGGGRGIRIESLDASQAPSAPV